MIDNSELLQKGYISFIPSDANKAKWARETLESFEKNNFPGRIKTNEIKLAEQILKDLKKDQNDNG